MMFNSDMKETSALTRESPFGVNIKNEKKNKFYPRAASAKISVKEFFDFIKTAYQVNESVEQLIPELLLDENAGVNWNDLANNPLVNQLMESETNATSAMPIKVETECQTEAKLTDRKENYCNELDLDNQPLLKTEEVADANSAGDSKSSGQKIIEMMNETINEGGKLEKANSRTSVNSNNGSKVSTKSVKNRGDENSSKTSINNAEPEVEIHVCDEVKHLKKDFRCSQSLLISKMGYFAEITSGQRLEDIDISVHCDIGIFDWLMRWTKKDDLLPEDWPKLEASCVAPILVSAVFLQMDPLIDDCLLFCHQHMNEILRTSTNLSCLNDMIITRLAAMYTNSELELIRDKKDKIISRLYCKLILSLGEPVPQSLRGHWVSLAGIYRCCKCAKLVPSKESADIPCIPSCMQVSLDGNIISEHVRDMNWNLSEFIVELYRELKTWRKVYWRLWAICHFLRCVECLTLFPVHQMSWCCRHPDQPQFFLAEGQRNTAIPIGRYPCCGARTYRFEVLTNTTQGCQFKEHVPDVKHPRDLAILSLFNQHRAVIEQPPPEIMIPEKLTKLVARDGGSDCKLFNSKEVLWWEGIELAPPRQKLGLLGKMCFVGRKEPSKLVKKPTSTFVEETVVPVQSPETPQSPYSSSEYSSSDGGPDEEGSESSSCSVESEHTDPILKMKRFRLYNKRGRRRRRTVTNGNVGRHWSPTLSARSNQDLQRDFEETAMQQITEFLSRRTAGTDSSFQRTSNKVQQCSSIWNHHITPIGGIYQRLEAEWCDNNRHPNTCPPKNPKAQIAYIVKPKFKVNRLEK